MKKIIKKVKSIIYRLLIKFKEKKFSYINNKKIKYLFFRNKSDKLIVVFSGFPEHNDNAKYNYIRSLSKFKMNKLFILDDFGYKNKGSYYLGEKGILNLDGYIISLIEQIKSKYNISSVYTLGSSKGGYAAIYYGTKIKANTIIAGAPQYYIGDYLNQNQYHQKLLKGIIGEKKKVGNEIEKLNLILKDVIENFDNNGEYIIHYSKKEPTYDKHIKYLLYDLKKSNKKVKEDIGYYENHSDVGVDMIKLIYKVFESER